MNIRKYLGHEGRIGRLQYLLYSFFTLSLGLLVGVIQMLTKTNADQSVEVLLILIVLAIYLLLMSFMVVKRLHDLGYSGWMFFVAMMPIINIFFGLIFLFKKGVTGPNKFGSDPLVE